jgi:hypothetical protein
LPAKFNGGFFEGFVPTSFFQTQQSAVMLHYRDFFLGLQTENPAFDGAANQKLGFAAK